MQVSLILFPVGAGGNFMSRVFSLDETTVPIGGYQGGTNFLNVQDRYNRYHYDQVLKNTGQDYNKLLKSGLTKWVDYELNNMYFPLTFGMEKLAKFNQHIVEPLHLWHIEDKMQLFGKDDLIKIYYVDCTDVEEWVCRQAITKGGMADITVADVFTECNALDQFANEKKLQSIQLKSILYDFETEYPRVCKIIGVRAHKQYAKQIFDSWKQTWQ